MEKLLILRLGSMGDVLQPIPDADIVDLAYFTARQP